MRPRADLARRSAALEAVKQLHERGELTEDLKVRSRERVECEEDDDDELLDSEEGRSGCRKYYKQYPPAALTTSPDADTFYLHTLDLRLVKPVSNPRYNLHRPEEDSHRLGLLTSNPLPSIGPLEIFAASGLVHAFINVKERHPRRLGQEELQLAWEFHRYIINSLKVTDGQLDVDHSSLPIVVPVLGRGGDIDWRMMEQVSRHEARRLSNPGHHLPYNLAQLARSGLHYLKSFRDLVNIVVTPFMITSKLKLKQ